MSKKSTFKIFVSKAKAFPKVRFKKPYIKKLYDGKVELKPHVIDPNKITFDISATIPADLHKRGLKHIKKNRFKYEFAGTAIAGYAGAKAAQGGKKK